GRNGTDDRALLVPANNRHVSAAAGTAHCSGQLIGQRVVDAQRAGARKGRDLRAEITAATGDRCDGFRQLRDTPASALVIGAGANLGGKPVVIPHVNLTAGGRRARQKPETSALDVYAERIEIHKMVRGRVTFEDCERIETVGVRV